MGYDSHAHAGKGKAQKLLWPAVGASPNKPTPHSSSAVVGPPQGAGHGKKGKGYNTDAHASNHHGKDGEAVGHTDSFRPMEYKSQLQSEGKGGLTPNGGGPAFVHDYHHNSPTKAAHHPRMGEPHKFDRPPSQEAHGFGHSGGERKGHLRMSGHSKGHRVGAK